MPPSESLAALFEGKYEFLRELGRGGFGVVYLARHSILEQLYAIKILSPNKDGLQDVPNDMLAVLLKETRERFLQEGKLLARLSKHPNIVKVMDSGALPDDRLYVIMEYVEGHSLFDELYPSPRAMAGRGSRRGQAIAPERARRITAALARTLHFAHDKGVVHRDVKPPNVMLQDPGTPQEFVKLLDFGIAKLVRLEGGVVTRYQPPYSPGYTAPEYPDLTEKSDQFSLGVLLYEMLAGEMPFAESLPAELDPPGRRLALDPSQLSPEFRRLEAVAMKMLSRRPEDRYESLDAVAQLLDVPTGGVGLPPPADPMGPPPPPPWRPMAYVAITALIVASVVLAALWRQAGGHPPPAGKPDAGILAPGKPDMAGKKGDEAIKPVPKDPAPPSPEKPPPPPHNSGSQHHKTRPPPPPPVQPIQLTVTLTAGTTRGCLVTCPTDHCSIKALVAGSCPVRVEGQDGGCAVAAKGYKTERITVQELRAKAKENKVEWKVTLRSL